MALFNRVLIIYIVHIFIVLYELKSICMNILNVDLGHSNVPAFAAFFISRKKVNSRMFHV
jgi:hypothetical protein